MKDRLEDELDSLGVEQSIDLVKELESQSIEKIRSLRAHERFNARVHVVLQPGNSSALTELTVQGTTGDVSRGGFGGIFPVPVQVGDVYRVTFVHEQLRVPLVFARCLCCRLVREDAFEAGFKFFNPITLPDAVKDKNKDFLA